MRWHRPSKAYREWSKNSTVAQRADADPQGRRAAHRAPASSSPRSSTARWARRSTSALGEIDFSAAIYEYYADNAEKFLADETIDLLDGEGSAIIRRGPVGVLLGIMPWNYPYYQVARFAGPNLTLGNTIVLKHAPQCPESAAAIQKIYDDAGFPKGAYVNVYATNEQIAEAIADPRVQGVSLTGSERAGAAVAEIAGRNLKKVVLELGGCDPFIVLSTDDLDATVDAAVAGRFENTGQACNAAKRFIVAADHLRRVPDQVHREGAGDRRGTGAAVLGGAPPNVSASRSTARWPTARNWCPTANARVPTSRPGC